MKHSPSAWKCPGGHVMGQVQRNGRGIRQLLLYRNAVDLEPNTDPREVEVLAVVEGYVADVRCSICGAIRPWVPGEEAMRKLLNRYQREHGLIVDKLGDSV